MKDLLEAIGNGIKEEIERAFKPLIVTIWYTTGKEWSLEVKKHVTPRHRFDVNEFPIGNIVLHSDHLACHGLIDYTTNDKTLYTRIEYADPAMNRRTCEAVYEMLKLAGQWKMMRDVMKIPVPTLEDQ